MDHPNRKFGLLLKIIMAAFILIALLLMAVVPLKDIPERVDRSIEMAQEPFNLPELAPLTNYQPPYPLPQLAQNTKTPLPYPWPPTPVPGMQDTEYAASYATQTAFIRKWQQTSTALVDNYLPPIGWDMRLQGSLCFRDPIAKYTLRIENGWIAETSTGSASLFITNYRPEKIRSYHGAPQGLPEDAIKIQKPAVELSAEQFTRDSIDNMVESDSYGGITITGSFPYKPGDYPGFIYALIDFDPVISINLDLGQRGILHTSIFLYTDNFTALYEALAILSSFDLSSASCMNSRPQLNEPPALPQPVLDFITGG